MSGPPKRATTAYFFFMADNRAKIIADHKLDSKKVADVAKMAGKIWGEMDEKARKPYDERAARDKARYEEEKAAYVPTEDDEGGKKKKAKKEKDENKPKRPMSGYFFFLGDNRAKIIADHKLEGKAVSEVTKAAGVVWSSMDDAKKKPYMDKAVKAKAQYEKDMAEYNKA